MPATSTSLNLQQDLVFQNQLTRQNAIWLMHGTTLEAGRYTTAVADANWSMVGVGDFNGDSNSDLVWRNQATGQNSIWLMRDTTLSSGVYINPVADQNWQIVGTGRFSLFAPPRYYMAGNNPNGISAGDFNGDANTDLVVSS